MEAFPGPWRDVRERDGCREMSSFPKALFVDDEEEFMDGPLGFNLIPALT
jgi:hypothetical protein